MTDEIALLIETPLENGSGTFSSTVFEKWRDVLLNELLAIPPSGFERLCQRVLRDSGFTKVEVTGRSGDGGIDGIGVLRISLLSFQVFFNASDTKEVSEQKKFVVSGVQWSEGLTKVC